MLSSSGRRETPFLDAKLRKLAVRDQVSTTSTTTLNPLPETTSVVALNNDSLLEVPEVIPSSTAANKIYESEESTDDDGGESDHEEELPDLNEDMRKMRELEVEIQEEEITNQDKPPLKSM